MSEKDEQIAVVDWFNIKYPHLSRCLIFIQNAQILSYMGSKAKIGRMYNSLVRQGFKKGVSDLLLAVPRGKYHGLWIEMKDHNKTKCSVSKDQWEHINTMREQGYFATWAAGAEPAMAIIENYMSELKELDNV